MGLNIKISKFNALEHYQNSKNFDVEGNVISRTANRRFAGSKKPMVFCMFHIKSIEKSYIIE